MIDVKKLCEDSHRISKDKGWLEEKRSFAACIALIHSELSEAIEDYRNNKPINEVFYEVKWSRLKLDEATGVGASEGGKSSISAKELAELRASGAEITSAKPCGVPSELADVIIRIAQHCGTEGHTEELLRSVTFIHSQVHPDPRITFEELIAFGHLDVALAFKSYSRRETNPEIYEHLAMAWVLIEGFCHHNNIDLEAAVIEKQAFNETRPHRHGGKKI